MLDVIAVSIAASVALILSLITASSALYLKRKFKPIVDSIDVEGLQGDFRELKESMLWFRKYAATAPNVMLDSAEGMIDEKMKVVVAEMEIMKDEMLTFANEYGQQALQGVAGIFQHKGAEILGKKGREKSLANAQIKAAKDQAMRVAVESQLPEGFTYEMVEQAAERMGFDMDEAQVWLQNPMVQQGLAKFLNKGGGAPPPMLTRGNSPPPVQASSGYRPLGGQ